MLDHHCPLEYRTNPYLLAVYYCIESAADFVVGRGNDRGKRNKLGDFVHLVASLGLGGAQAAEIKKAPRGPRQQRMLPEVFRRIRRPKAALYGYAAELCCS